MVDEVGKNCDINSLVRFAVVHEGFLQLLLLFPLFLMVVYILFVENGQLYEEI